ncbi:MAG: pitrilysin family protein [Armatimonadota bacterium]
MFLEKAYLTSDIIRMQLPNGVTIITKEIYPAKVACFGVWIRSGSIDEPEDLKGISHFVEHMLFKRTPKRGLGEISRQINALGGYLNGSTSYTFTNYWVVVPSKYFDVALDIQTDAVLNPIFDDYDIEKERKVILEEIKMGMDSPSNFLFDKLLEEAYKKHPLRHSILGYEDILNKIDKNTLKKYYTEKYVPNNIVITAVGDIKSEEVIKSVTNLYGGLKNVPLSVNLFDADEPRQAGFRYKEYTGDVKKAYLMMAFHIPTLLHRDIYALDLLAVAMGEGLSSRLNVVLKEKKMLVNYIYTGILSGNYPGLFLIEANLDKEDVKKAVEEIFKEIDKVKYKLIPNQELKKAKNLFLSDYIFSQEAVEEQSENIGYYEIAGDCMLSEEFPKRMLEVEAKDMRKVAQDYLNRENCSVAVYLPK